MTISSAGRRWRPAEQSCSAVARKDLNGCSGENWPPIETITRAEALALFTTAPAYASFQEADFGTIEVGKKADVTVFSKDIMAAAEVEILTAKPVLTIVDGVIVVRAAG